MGVLSPFKNLRIKYKLLISYLLAFILTVSLGSAIIYAIVRQTIENRVESELSNTTSMILNMVRTTTAVSIKNHLRTIAEKNKEIVEYFYSLFQKGQLSETQARHLASAVLLSQTIGTTGYIYCLSSKGIILVHPKQALLGADLTSYDFIKQQQRMQHGYIEYDWKNPGETQTRPKALYMTYFKPWDWIISASSYRNEFQNLVDIDDFRDSIQALHFGGAGYAIVLDISGKLVAGPKNMPTVLDLNNPTLGPFIDRIVKLRTGKLILKSNRSAAPPAHVMAIFNEIPNFKWIVACFINLDEVYSPLATIINVMIYIVILSLMLFLPLTLWISGSITKPLQELTNTLDVGHKQNLPSPMPPTSRDEVEILVRYFNMFMKQLEISDMELQAEMIERKRAEDAIRESEKKYRELVQNANSIILQVDPEGYIIFMNDYALKYFQYEADDILGKHLVGTIVAEKVAPDKCLLALIEATLPKKTAKVNPIFEHQRKNGEQMWVSWTSRAVLDNDSNLKEYLCIGNDVTARIKMEEVMIQTEKMISIGGLAAGMAHEINNPLGVMVQNTQNIIRRISPDLQKNETVAQQCGTQMDVIKAYINARSIDKFLEDILQSGIRAASIVNDMLDFSRRSDESKEAVDLAQLLDKTIELAAHDYDLKKKYDFRKIKITREFEEGVAPFFCFPMEILQVILNLLRNAAQATNLQTQNAADEPFEAQITLRLKTDGQTIQIEIQDNGPGMNDATRKRVFEPFFTTKPVGVGTGLGLSVSYFIITNRHQGMLYVQSEPGQGSRFIITLPIHPQEDVTQEGHQA